MLILMDRLQIKINYIYSVLIAGSSHIVEVGLLMMLMLMQMGLFWF